MNRPNHHKHNRQNKQPVGPPPASFAAQNAGLRQESDRLPQLPKADSLDSHIEELVGALAPASAAPAPPAGNVAPARASTEPAGGEPPDHLLEEELGDAPDYSRPVRRSEEERQQVRAHQERIDMPREKVREQPVAPPVAPPVEQSTAQPAERPNRPRMSAEEGIARLMGYDPQQHRAGWIERQGDEAISWLSRNRISVVKVFIGLAVIGVFGFGSFWISSQTKANTEQTATVLERLDTLERKQKEQDEQSRVFERRQADNLATTNKLAEIVGSTAKELAAASQKERQELQLQLETTQSDLSATRERLESAQSQIAQTQEEVVKTKSEVERTQTQLANEVQQTELELVKAQLAVQTKEQELEKAQRDEVAAAAEALRRNAYVEEESKRMTECRERAEAAEKSVANIRFWTWGKAARRQQAEQAQAEMAELQQKLDRGGEARSKALTLQRVTREHREAAELALTQSRIRLGSLEQLLVVKRQSLPARAPSSGPLEIPAVGQK